MSKKNINLDVHGISLDILDMNHHVLGFTLTTMSNENINLDVLDINLYFLSIILDGIDMNKNSFGFT